MLIRDWLRHPTIDARAWVVHLLLTVMSVEDAFAFHAWVPVKFSVGVKHEFANVFFLYLDSQTMNIDKFGS